MRIIALIIGIMLVSASNVGAIDPPGQTDLASMSESQNVRSYTGIIKNKTRYEISIPSENSDATLLIPPNGWIEFTIWTQHSGVTAYHNGKPFYCLNIFAHPQLYSFMCKKYDFMAEIRPPAPEYKPIQQKRHFKKRPKCDEGVEALG